MSEMLWEVRRLANEHVSLFFGHRPLGVSAPFDASGFGVVYAAQHRDQASQHVQRSWHDTHMHISPRSCPSAGARIIAGFRVLVLLQSLTLSCH